MDVRPIILCDSRRVSSYVMDLTHGTIQSSILGPILYAIYISPLFDLTDITNFADENFAIEWSDTIHDLIDNMQTKLEVIIEWLKDLGLDVNESKTELCLFHRKDHHPITLFLSGQEITSKMVPSSSKNNNKAKSTLLPIKLIKPYFTNQDLKQITISNFYSILF